jgi:hypothetical protein
MQPNSWWDEPGSRRGLLLATCLTHSLPTATMALRFADGGSLLISHRNPNASMTPCDFRQVVLDTSGVRSTFDVLRRVARWEIGGGVQHLGAGIYGAAHPADGTRSFATAIPADGVLALTERCPDDVANDRVEVSIKPDQQLGACTVMVGSTGGEVGAADHVAFWLAGACMVEELILPGGPPSLRC